MNPSSPFRASPLFILGFIALAGCHCRHPSLAPNASPAVKDIVATVNGAPITEFDVRQEARGHGGEVTPDQRKSTLENLIREEMLAQKAADIGLEKDPVYQERMARAEAQLRAVRRRELSDVYFRREIVEKAAASEDEARDFFAKNEGPIRTELHVWQILMRDETEIGRALADIKAGKPFEEVAGRQFPNLPPGGQTPWDLGFLKWKQVPAAWRNVIYTLKPGEVSPVISGPNHRSWIVKLVERREDPALTFDSAKATILDELRSLRIESQRAQVEQELRKAAKIVYVTLP